MGHKPCSELISRQQSNDELILVKIFVTNLFSDVLLNLTNCGNLKSLFYLQMQKSHVSVESYLYIFDFHLMTLS